MSKLIKLYALNRLFFLYINYTPIKLFLKSAQVIFKLSFQMSVFLKLYHEHGSQGHDTPVCCSLRLWGRACDLLLQRPEVHSDTQTQKPQK